MYVGYKICFLFPENRTNKAATEIIAVWERMKGFGSRIPD